MTPKSRSISDRVHAQRERAGGRMKISIFAVGRMKAGPEKELADRYFERFSKSGPAIGLEFSGLTEIPESRAQSAAERKREEADRLRQHLAAGAALVMLDERGKSISS